MKYVAWVLGCLFCGSLVYADTFCVIGGESISEGDRFVECQLSNGQMVDLPVCTPHALTFSETTWKIIRRELLVEHIITEDTNVLSCELLP